ncbi:3-oxoacyl-(acyl-carrier-protein) synthase [Lachnotalea glycerini]|uniref:3-oxoacyl-(Acyl-carrier-protein) synthase n=1 Tax=Lachnotalea glycerini TaxID=1763509 RepID=A0A318F104_9FIRM|nr:beta-ketoacyl synthase N-terminal-like domain-containing protein [Lachnotalea glycerini]PXV95568.1 3-oxoacyl-(acyl-carrier-protein) synthase [Lachnotalea glycerini]
MKKYINNVLITGLGAVTPFGCSLESIFEKVLDLQIIQEGGQECISKMVINRSHSMVTCKELFLCMCKDAIENAIADWGKDRMKFFDVPLILGSGLGLTDALGEQSYKLTGSNFLSEIGDELKKTYEFIGSVYYFSNACAASSQAVCYGADLIGYGEKEIAIVGGVDIYSNIAKAGFERLCSLDQTGCHPFDAGRKGISVGEGAAFFILESESSNTVISPLQASESMHVNIDKSYARIMGYGSTNDAFDVVRMDTQGTQIIRAMEQAVTMGNIKKQQITAVIAHGTGTKLNDKVEAKQISCFFRDCGKIPYVVAPKGMFGHTGGASGAISLLYAIGIFQYHMLPAIPGLVNKDQEISIPLVDRESMKIEAKYILINCFAFGGSNVVLLVGK